MIHIPNFILIIKMKKCKKGTFYSKEEVRELELSGFVNPIRKVTLIDGSHVHIDRVTGITCSLEEEQKKKEQREENYRQRMRIKYQLNELNQEEN